MLLALLLCCRDPAPPAPPTVRDEFHRILAASEELSALVEGGHYSERTKEAMREQLVAYEEEMRRIVAATPSAMRTADMAPYE